MKVAQYKTRRGTTIIFEEGGMIGDTEYIQVSEVVDVEFPPLDPMDVQRKEITNIDKQIKAFQAASQITLNNLERRKAELLALPNTPGRVGE